MLAALKGLAELGLVRDKRCVDGLDLLQSKELPDGGWAAEARYYRVATRPVGSGAEYVDWGGVHAHRMNEWVTTDALAVLTAAGFSRRS